MEAWKIIVISLGYLGALFLIAHLIDKNARKGHHFIKYKWVYALSIPVYCTAWTFYGSVGKAVSDGWEFLTTYIGPLLTIPLWWLIIRKLIRICEVQRISTLPDLISSRYGKSVSLSVLASFLIIVGIIPYISIQLKSITSSFEILAYGTYQETNLNSIFLNDFAFYLSLILAAFIIVFVFRSIETTDKHYGMMGAIAIDSIVKLIAFLAVGLFVTYSVFNGFGDIFNRASPELAVKFQQIPDSKSFDWFFLLLLSMSAILLLPRQFQVTIAENVDENHIKTAEWVFPLYLFLINIFVVPIALAGKQVLPASVDPDSYVLALPLMGGVDWLALLTFIGGFSAATGMIIVSTISLSMIASNNIFVPLLLKQVEEKKVYAHLPLRSRRLSVFVILLLAYVYYKFIANQYSIVSIGLISFAAMIQFMPGVIGALYWKDANKKGAIAGLIVGFLVWGFTLVIPTIVATGVISESIMTDGLFSLSWLKPQALFGSNFSPITNGTLWSLFFNTGLFVFISLFTTQSAKERNMAEVYVDIFQYSSQSDEHLVWKGELVHKDLILLSENLLGKERTQQLIAEYEQQYGAIDHQKMNDARFVNFIERQLSGAVGSASSRMLIASVAKEEEIEINDVVRLLKETNKVSMLNKALKSKSNELMHRTGELESANQRLQNIDKEKDDFISTVTHELRTPLTSIKAFVEIILDNPDLEEREQFLETINDEIDRMTRLINEVLDIEKLTSGVASIEQDEVLPGQIIEESLSGMEHLLKSKNIKVLKDLSAGFDDQIIIGDGDRLKQVFVNLLSNAIKHSKGPDPQITIKGGINSNSMKVSIIDNGKGIKEENLSNIFDKFFQARDQTSKKPKGTGLGLSITKKIMELHGGSIEAESEWEVGSKFTVKFPLPKKL